MKKADLSLLLITLSLMMIITVGMVRDNLQLYEGKGLPEIIEQGTGAGVQSLSDKISVDYTGFTEPVQNENVYETKNGLQLTLEKIFNYRDEIKDVIVSIPAEETNLYFNITIAPQKLWTYAIIDASFGSIIIIPKSTAVVDTNETSYYELGEELIVRLNPSETKEVYIYTGKKGLPSLILAGTSAHYEYDRDLEVVDIRSTDGFLQNITVFWPDMAYNVAFLEDTQKIESINHEAGGMKMQTSEMKDFVEIKQQNISMLKKDVAVAEMSVENLRLEKESLMSQAEQLNQTTQDLENKITSNVLMPPSNITIFYIVVAILALILIDAAIFRPKKSQKK